MSAIPMTPAEQQVVLSDAEVRLIAGDGPHNRAVLAHAMGLLQQKTPILEAAIASCRGCKGSQEGCDDCRAFRLELAALLGY